MVFKQAGSQNMFMGGGAVRSHGRPPAFHRGERRAGIPNFYMPSYGSCREYGDSKLATQLAKSDPS